VRHLTLLLLCLCAFPPVQAETRYVTDQCSVPMRKGDALKYKVVRMLPSGTALEVIGGKAGTGFVQVRTPEGNTGWVASAEMQTEPAARNHLAAMEARLAELQQAPEAMAGKLAALQTQHASLQAEHERMGRERDRLEQELASLRNASANIVEVTNDRADLRTRVAELTRQAADLEQETRDLKLQTDQRWFLIGAGVVGGGIIIGLILPRLRFRRRKSSWGSL
jgi:SH3 domain protein